MKGKRKTKSMPVADKLDKDIQKLIKSLSLHDSEKLDEFIKADKNRKSLERPIKKIKDNLIKESLFKEKANNANCEVLNV